MAAFKQLNSQDLIVSPLELNKGFRFEGAASFTGSNVSIERYLGTNGEYIKNSSTTGETHLLSTVLTFESIQHLYYSNYINGSDGEVALAATASFLPDGTITGSSHTNNFFNYNQTDLNPYKSFPTSSKKIKVFNPFDLQVLTKKNTGNLKIGVISIPSKLYGDKIQPGSLVMNSPISGSVLDDGEGRLYTDITGTRQYVGNIIYPHGMVVLTNDSVQTLDSDSDYGTAIYSEDDYGGTTPKSSPFIETYISENNITISFSSSYTLYETQYKVSMGADEYNYSTNPSILTGSSSETMLGFATSSYFAPYVTTVGLYNNNHELLAVGKLAKPLPTSKNIDTTILINFDTQ